MIAYVDYEFGSNAGDGSAGNPYKTIQYASTLADDIRVAKSPDNTPLTGTLIWQDGSPTIIGNGTLFTSELVVGDYIVDPYGFYHEVTSITDDTTLGVGWTWFIEQPYDPNVQTIEAASEKVGYIENMETPGWDYLGASGVSPAAKILVSGGWDLGSETQTGVTTIWDNAGANYGLTISDFINIRVEKINLLNFNGGEAFNQNDGGFCILWGGLVDEDMNVEIVNCKTAGGMNGVYVDAEGVLVENFQSSNDQYGFYENSEFSAYSKHYTLKNVRFGFNASYGAYFFEAIESDIDGLYALSCQNSGLYGGSYCDSGGSRSGNNIIKNVSCYRCGEGIYWVGGFNDDFDNLVAKYNGGNGFVWEDFSSDVFIGKIISTHNGTGLNIYNIRSGRIGYVEASYNSGNGIDFGGGNAEALKIGEAYLIGNAGLPINYAPDVYSGDCYSVTFEKLVMKDDGNGWVGATESIGGQFDWPAVATDIIPFYVISGVPQRPNSGKLRVGDFVQDFDGQWQEIIAIPDQDTIQIAANYTGTSGQNGVTRQDHKNQLPFMQPSSYPNREYRWPIRVGIMVSDFQGTGLAENRFLHGYTRGNDTVPRGGSGKCLEFQPWSKDGVMPHSFFIKSAAEVNKAFSIYTRKDADFNGVLEMAVYNAHRKLTEWVDITPTANNTYEQKIVSVSGIEVRFDSIFEVVVRCKNGDFGSAFVDDLSLVSTTEPISWGYDSLATVEDVALAVV